MNNEKLYNGLMSLVQNSEKDEFYFDDKEQDGVIYRIFNYRLVNFTTFTENEFAPYARGIMFEVDANGAFIRLVCLPMNKFFNYAEGGVAHDSANVSVLAIYDKLDGSLISSYLHKGELRLKSKGSLNSNQANAAMAFLAKPENASLHKFIKTCTENNLTVNMEWTSPNNRIVIGYSHDELRILNTRDLNTHTLTMPDEWVGLRYASTAVRHDRHSKLLSGEMTLTELVDNMYREETGEGYIINLMKHDTKTAYQVKVKNFKYCNLHKIKDSINTPTALCELVIRGQTDDLVEAFTSDELALQTISEMENLVIPIYNKLVVGIEQFHAEMKNCDRKTYAIEAKRVLGKQMPLAMNKYLGYETDFEIYAVKNMAELFGITNKEKQ